MSDYLDKLNSRVLKLENQEPLSTLVVSKVKSQNNICKWSTIFVRKIEIHSLSNSKDWPIGMDGTMTEEHINFGRTFRMVH